MIVTVTLTPALDKTVILPDFRVNEVNRIQSLRLDPGGKGINVSKGLRALGVDSLATGILGGDTGRYIEKSLHEAGIACDRIRLVDRVMPPQRHMVGMRKRCGRDELLELCPLFLCCRHILHGKDHFQKTSFALSADGPQSSSSPAAA